MRTRAGCPSTRKRFAFISWTGPELCGIAAIYLKIFISFQKA